MASQAPDGFSDFMKSKMNAIFSILSIHIQAKSQRTSLTLDEYIRTLQAQGMDKSAIKSLLYKDLSEGGRIFGEFFNSLGADIRGAMNQTMHSAKLARLGFESDDLLMWQVESENPCPDCLGRDGKVDTYENWQIRGLPGSGWSVCRENCLCDLKITKEVLN